MEEIVVRCRLGEQIPKHRHRPSCDAYGVKYGFMGALREPAWKLAKTTLGTTLLLPKHSKNFLLTPDHSNKLLILNNISTLGNRL
jgi:hypothetical protein